MDLLCLEKSFGKPQTRIPPFDLINHPQSDCTLMALGYFVNHIVI